jgi:hypothetical protein
LRFTAAMVLATLLFPQDETAAEGAASISPVSGDLRVWRGVRKKLEPVAKATLLEAGDRVGSPKGEPVVLVSDDDIVLSVKGVKVGEKTGLLLVRTKDGLVVRLQDGAVLVDAFDKPLTVETAGGKATGKQAYFLVEVKDGVSKVTAIDGTLSLSNSVGEVAVESGQESSLKSGEAPSEPKPASTVVAPPDFAPKGASPNLLKNPGFEQEPGAVWPAAEGAEKARTVDDRVALAGRRSLRVTATPASVKRLEPPQTTRVGVEQEVKFVKGRRYLVRVYVKMQVRKGKVKAALGVNGAKAPADPEDYHWQTAAIGDSWRMMRTILEATRETGDVMMRLYLEDADYDATMWVDEWSMVELPPVAAPKKP